MTGTSKEYAIALFNLGKECAIETELSENLAFLKDVFACTPEYAAFLSAPSIPKQERLDTIQNTFGEELHEYAVSFLSLLCEQGNIDILAECVDEYDTLYSESQKVSHAVVASAVELTDAEKAKLQKKLEKLSGHRVDIEYHIKKKLLGGLIVDMDGMRLDGSLRRQLKNIREVMDEWAEDPTKSAIS